MIKMKSKILSAFLVGLCLLMTTAVSANERYGKQKVVYHINYDDPKMQAGALGNVQNHINAVGAENLDLKVVLHGNGLSLLLEPEALVRVPKFKHANADQKMTAIIDTLKGQGIEFKVCENTVRGRKVDVDGDLYNVDAKDIVPSGVAELARLQSMGYTYIKP